MQINREDDVMSPVDTKKAGAAKKESGDGKSQQRIANNIIELIGNTPLVRVNKMAEGCVADVVLKLEFYNPLGSVKDRIGFAMIEAAEKSGKVNKDKTIFIEATSG